MAESVASDLAIARLIQKLANSRRRSVIGRPKDVEDSEEQGVQPTDPATETTSGPTAESDPGRP